MVAIASVPLSYEGVGLTAAADTVAATSAALTAGRTYLVVGAGSAANVGSAGDDNAVDLLVGGVVHARMRGQHAAFSPTGTLGNRANGAYGGIGAAFTYTPAAADTMQARAWADVASGDSYGHFFALDLTDIEDTGGDQGRWHQETANSDAIVDTPTSGWEAVGSALTFTAPASGDYVLVASVELVGDGTAADTDEMATRVVVDGVALVGTAVEGDVGGRADEVRSFMWLRPVTLTAASHTIRIEVNGTQGSGNVGARRIRVHAVQASRLGAVVEVTHAGETISPLADVDPTGLATTIGNNSNDYLLFTQFQHAGSFWVEGHLVVGGTESPANGFGVGGSYDGASGGGPDGSEDQTLFTGIDVVSAPAASTAVQVRLSKMGSYGVNTFGEDVLRASGGRMSLVAIQLESVAAPGGSGITLTPAAVSASWAVPTATPAPGGTLAGAAPSVGQFATPTALAVETAIQAPPAVVFLVATPTAVGAVGGAVSAPTPAVAQWAVGSPSTGSTPPITLAPSAVVGTLGTVSPSTSVLVALAPEPVGATCASVSPASAVGVVSSTPTAVGAVFLVLAPGTSGDITSLEPPLGLELHAAEVFNLTLDTNVVFGLRLHTE